MAGITFTRSFPPVRGLTRKQAISVPMHSLETATVATRPQAS